MEESSGTKPKVLERVHNTATNCRCTTPEQMDNVMAEDVQIAGTKVEVYFSVGAKIVPTAEDSINVLPSGELPQDTKSSTPSPVKFQSNNLTGIVSSLKQVAPDLNHKFGSEMVDEEAEENHMIASENTDIGPMKNQNSEFDHISMEQEEILPEEVTQNTFLEFSTSQIGTQSRIYSGDLLGPPTGDAAKDHTHLEKQLDNASNNIALQQLLPGQEIAIEGPIHLEDTVEGSLSLPRHGQVSLTSSEEHLMEDEPEFWPWSAEEFRNSDVMKQNFTKFWSSIQKYYESSAPQRVIPRLTPDDLHRKWRLASHKDKELCSKIMNVAPSVVSVSVFSGVMRYLDCSGFIIDWDDTNKKATILTSAKVMRFPGKRDDYYIAIRLANGKILLGEEDYVDFYNNIVTLKVHSDATLKPLKSTETAEGVVVALGREFYTSKLSESSGVVRRDHPYFGCELLISSTCSGSQVLEGGPLITRMGDVCGINFYDGSKYVHPLPTLVIYSCLNKWNARCTSTVMWPWFGMSVMDIAQLPLDAMENIAGVCGDSAVVKEVYEGSPADKVGVHRGEEVTTLKMSGKKTIINSTSEYVRALKKISGEISGELSDCPEILVSVRGYNSDLSKEVPAELLRVDDKKFCYSWIVDESDETDWDFELQFGSQKEPAHDIYEPAGMSDDVTMY